MSESMTRTLLLHPYMSWRKQRRGRLVLRSFRAGSAPTLQSPKGNQWRTNAPVGFAAGVKAMRQRPTTERRLTIKLRDGEERKRDVALIPDIRPCAPNEVSRARKRSFGVPAISNATPPKAGERRSGARS